MNSNNPTVSIIIPVYNGEKFLKEVVNSALKQSFKNFELLIVDDGSTDNTPNIAKHFAKKEKRIFYLKQKHKGLFPTRNYALKNSRGKYIALLDSDDVWRKNHLKDSVGFLEENPDVALVFSRVKVVPENNNSLKQIKKCKRLNEWYKKSINNLILNDDVVKTKKGFKFKESMFQRIMKGYCIQNSTKVMRKDAIFDVGMYNANLITGGDIEFAFRLSRKYSFGLIDKVDTIYRIHDNNLHLNVSRNKYVEIWLIAKRYQGLSKNELKIIKSQISDFYKNRGYAFFIKNRFKKSFSYFLKASRENPNFFSLKYLIILYLIPKRLLLLYNKRYKNQTKINNIII